MFALGPISLAVVRSPPMWTYIIMLFFATIPTAADSEALRQTAPAYLTADTAREHLRAARVAGAIYRVDPALLLSIAHHESRYAYREVTLEAAGKVSCGAMTPEPTYDRDACLRASSSVLGGYLAGAAHLRTWLAATRGSLRTALLGYAGGFHLIRWCQDNRARQCDTPDVFLGRAAWIRRHLSTPWS